MKIALACLMILFGSVLSHAAIQEGNIFFVPVEQSKYQLGSGKSATIEIQVAFLN
jgi:hypothetical protein